MIRIRAPGRICLFGEHQDYLGYPIIAMAISKYIYLDAERIAEQKFHINLPNINDVIEFPLNNKELSYTSKRDYIRSGYNQFLRKGVKFDKGYEIKIIGDIPINAGAASSSALVMAWLYFLNEISNKFLNNFQLANEGYKTEVKEFNEAGGKMDFFSSINGNLIYLEPIEPPNLLNFNVKLNGFVLGNSLEKKDTVNDLIKVKKTALEGFNILKEIVPNFNQFSAKLEDIQDFLPNLNKEQEKKILGNLINRDITCKAKDLFLKFESILKRKAKLKKATEFYQKLGNLLNLHQEQLRENIGISTKKIDKIISNCLEAGALGAKINGSGFGGTMFALSSGNEDFIEKAIETAGGDAFLIKTSNGVELY